jgi:ABC-type branched-subunit amino acid transport system substrate-binding protein
VKQVVEAQQPASREAMREALRRVNSFPGVTGKTSFISGTDAQKEVRILTIKNGTIQEITLPENRGATEETGDPGVPTAPGGTR